MSEPEIVVEHRAELAYLLTEAAEIEHGLMCCYLYAAYSLKDRDEPGLSADEGAAVARFRDVILDVARDEMAHLALVSNLLSAIGAAPHWQRQNFPVSPGYHPAGVVVSLAPFDRATLDHFLYLERPEGMDLPDGIGFGHPRAYERRQQHGRLVPSAQDYQTVGHLYRGIRAGLEQLCARWGAERLFCGDVRVQMGPPVLDMRGLLPVVDLPSALAAVDTIVTQGEGSPGHMDGSHYQRFLSLRTELDALQKQNPAFAPAHSAARNPVMRKPPVPENRVWVHAEPAAAVLDLANAVYALMLASLEVLFSRPFEDPDMRDALVSLPLACMRAVAVLSRYLPHLHATDDKDGPRAGMTFTISRWRNGFPDVPRGLSLLAEQARLLLRGYDHIETLVGARFASSRDSIAELAKRLESFA